MPTFLKKLLTKLKVIISTRIFGNISTVMIGASFSQLITFTAYPILTRLYDPVAFGILGSFTALSSILSPLAALCLPIAIVLPKSDVEARSIAKLSIIIGIVLSILSSLTLYLISISSYQFNILSILGFSVYWLGPMVLFSSWLQVCSQVLTRYEFFGYFSICLVLQAIISNGLKIILGQSNDSGNVLIFGTVIGPLIFTITYLLLSRSTPYDSKLRTEPPTPISTVVIKYKSYPLYRTPQVILSTLSQAAPVFLLATYFGAEYVGFYVLARLVIDTPVHLIGRGVSSVVYPRLASGRESKQFVFKLISTTTFALLILGICLFATTFIFGTEIFNFIFGDEWILAGKFAELLSVLAFANLLNKACVSAIPVLNLEKWLLSIEVMGAIFRISIMLITFKLTESATDSVFSFAAAGALAQIYLITRILKHTSKDIT